MILLAMNLVDPYKIVDLQLFLASRLRMLPIFALTADPADKFGASVGARMFDGDVAVR